MTIVIVTKKKGRVKTTFSSFLNEQINLQRDDDALPMYQPVSPLIGVSLLVYLSPRIIVLRKR